ncbi:hypothetical protein CAC42_6234 [Sphaceloma murrayae]|uniref:Uncharacterized protein n=1 Tax=Sphaceloma murrayae TaxID=2082308 RepID=A0A2K1QTM1_9PEZI|nr:hypothetical protein CAC42_6234 [Sphaceloma murrayae]
MPISFPLSPKRAEEQRREKRRQALKRSISNPLETGSEHLSSSPEAAQRPSLSAAATASTAIPLGAITQTIDRRPELARITSAPGVLDEDDISPIIPSSGPLSSTAQGQRLSPLHRTPRPVRALHPTEVGLPSAPDAYRGHAQVVSKGTVTAQGPSQASTSRSSRRAEKAPATEQADVTPEVRSATDAAQAHALMSQLHAERMSKYDSDVATWRRVERGEPLETVEDCGRSSSSLSRRRSELAQAEMLRDAEVEAWSRRQAQLGKLAMTPERDPVRPESWYTEIDTAPVTPLYPPGDRAEPSLDDFLAPPVQPGVPSEAGVATRSGTWEGGETCRSPEEHRRAYEEANPDRYRRGMPIRRAESRRRKGKGKEKKKE